MSTQWNPPGNPAADSGSDTGHGGEPVAGSDALGQEPLVQETAQEVDGEAVDDDAVAESTSGNVLRDAIENHKPAVFAGLGLISALAVFGIGYALGGSGGSGDEEQPHVTEQYVAVSEEPAQTTDESHDNASTTALQLQDEGITRTPLGDEADALDETLSVTSQHTPSSSSRVSEDHTAAPSAPQGGGDNSAKPENKSDSDGNTKADGKQEVPAGDVVEINKPFEVAPGFVVAVSEPYLLTHAGSDDLLCVKTAYANRTGRIAQFDANHWRMRTPKGSTLLPPVERPDAEGEGLLKSPIENNEALDADVCFNYFDVGRYQFIYDNPALEKVMTWQATF